MYSRTPLEKSSLIDCPRYKLLISRLHEAGPRPIGEFIAELRRLQPRLPIMDLLERYASIDPAAVRALGADRWAANVFLVTSNIRSDTRRAARRRSRDW